MIPAILALYDRNLDYARRLVADIPDAGMTAQPPGAPQMNHAAWVLGHLAFGADRLGEQLGLPATASATWLSLYGMDSKPQADRAVYESKSALLQALETGHARVAAALRQLDPAVLSQPPADERRRARFPTIAMYVLYLCVGHEQLHLGQFSAWRRAQGLPSV